ncbi:MAG: Uncharacterised protein [Bacteroidota bacterium]|nr:MAG: Uncharacterised protein [Bacteroidota bacterium]
MSLIFPINLKSYLTYITTDLKEIGTNLMMLYLMAIHKK